MLLICMQIYKDRHKRINKTQEVDNKRGKRIDSDSSHLRIISNHLLLFLTKFSYLLI